MRYFGMFVVVNDFFYIFIQSIKTRDEKFIENY
jgi:hypothetical protein